MLSGIVVSGVEDLLQILVNFGGRHTCDIVESNASKSFPETWLG
jgi:hypothetical protein